jgi:hypothetical protein
MIQRHRVPLMMLSAPIKTGIQMPLPIALNGFRGLDRPRSLVIRNRLRKAITGKSLPLATRILRFLGLSKTAKSKPSPKLAAAIKRAKAMTAITPQEYLF